MRDEYKTIKSGLESEMKIQRSKFIANSVRVDSIEEFSNKIISIKKKYYDAGHHPYAYKIVSDSSDIIKYSDDGEPTYSSGKPILDAISKHELNNVAVIVTRYFGGIKLGVGGLRRAYFDAADENLSKAKVLKVYDTSRMLLKFDYTYMNSILRLLQEKKCKIIGNDSDKKVKLEVEFKKSDKDLLLKTFSEISNGTIEINEK